ncbi:MAG: hypothetical protein F6K36_11490 [Symploca sp. SIO3C6]|nr:hypothetical protein [Symploca sp. SIO3C6]
MHKVRGVNPPQPQEFSGLKPQNIREFAAACDRRHIIGKLFQSKKL